MTSIDHNNRSSQGHVPDTGSFSYEQFEKFPRELRDFLNGLEFIHCTDMITTVLAEGMSVEEVMQRIKDGVRLKIEIDRSEVWGIR